MALTTRDLTRIDNTIRPRTVVSWTMIGSSWTNGRRYPGCTKLLLDGGGFVYYPEHIAIGQALDDAADLGYNVSDARAKLAEWIKTGKGVSFSLR